MYIFDYKYRKTNEEAESMKVEYNKQISKLNQEMGKRLRIIQETKKKYRKEQLKVVEMTKNVKSFNIKALKSDLEYIKEMQNSKNDTIIDEKVALSSLVNKLQQYVFDIEQTALKEELGIEDTQHNDDDYGYSIEDVNFKSPIKQFDSPDNLSPEGEESETLYLGNSLELEKRLKQFVNMKKELKTDLPSQDDDDSLQNPLSDHTSSANNNSQGSYAQKYMKKRRRNN